MPPLLNRAGCYHPMEAKKYVVFDFDGTIADTLDLAFAIFNRIAPDYHVRQADKQELELLRSRKPQELLKLYGITRLRLLTLLLRIQKELTHHISEAALVQGMESSLRQLRRAGFSLGILTSNSRENVARFLEHHALGGLMDFIYSGNSLFGKDKIIRRMLGKEKIAREHVVYTGDETRDIEACHRAGIPVIAVSWGLQGRDLLATSHPDYLVDDPAELLPLVQHIFNGE